MNAGGIYAHEIGRLAGVHVPLVAMAHQYAITKPTGLSRDMPTLRDPAPPGLLPRGEWRAGHGRLRAQSSCGDWRHRRGLQLAPPRAGLGPLRAALRGGDLARPRTGRRRDRDLDQRARGLHARRRVHPRRERGRGVLGRGRVLRPRHRRLGRHGQADGRVDHRGPAEPRRLGARLATVRAPVPESRATRSCAPTRSTRRTTT